MPRLPLEQAAFAALLSTTTTMMMSDHHPAPLLLAVAPAAAAAVVVVQVVAMTAMADNWSSYRDIKVPQNNSVLPTYVLAVVTS